MGKKITIRFGNPAKRPRAIDEKCYCGHLRSQHIGGIPGLNLGHGPCAATHRRRVCRCAKFTWASYIYASQKKTPVSELPAVAALQTIRENRKRHGRGRGGR